jgi:hypothetical protein
MPTSTGSFYLKGQEKLFSIAHVGKVERLNNASLSCVQRKDTYKTKMVHTSPTGKGMTGSTVYSLGPLKHETSYSGKSVYFILTPISLYIALYYCSYRNIIITSVAKYKKIQNDLVQSLYESSLDWRIVCLGGFSADPLSDGPSFPL